MLFGQEHVERYRATDGEEGHEWQGTVTLLLTTTGRKSGEPRRTPVGARREGESLWLVAEHGEKAAYVRNIQANPRVRVKMRGGWRTGRRPWRWTGWNRKTGSSGWWTTGRIMPCWCGCPRRRW